MPSSQERPDQIHEKSSLEVESAECNADFFGPSLPPHLLKKRNDEKIYGPTLPCNFSTKEDSSSIIASTSDEKGKILIGPELPGHLKLSATTVAELEEEAKSVTQNSDDDDNNFGPSTALMASGDVTGYYKHMHAQNRDTTVASDSNTEREAWMTELPEKKRANFGLVPRQFKSRIQTDKESDSSVWTDTPADKKRKERANKKDHKEMLKKQRLEDRDKEMEKLVRKAAKKLRKKESLLEIHQKNMKAKQKKRQKEGDTLPERRPFDRNIDLQIRKSDENQKRSILSKSQFLNDRFASGESKFL